MMGIKEKARRGEAQEKMASSESRQRTGPSLSNWFGLRRSSKKVEASRSKEEKKELKTAPGRRKEKKRSESQQTEGRDGQTLAEVDSKLSAIMDHCNNQVGQLALAAQEQLVRELLAR